MVTCGIDIASSSAYFVVLEKAGGVINDITGKFTKLNIKNDENCKEIRSFAETIKTHFDSIKPDRIGIVKRNKGGPFPGGAVSFKIEGLIQLYEKKNIILVSPVTLRCFEKRYQCRPPTYKYQEMSNLLALFLLEG